MTSIKKVFENEHLLRFIFSYVVIPKYYLENWTEEVFNIKIPNSDYKEDEYRENMNHYHESYDYLIIVKYSSNYFKKITSDIIRVTSLFM